MEDVYFTILELFQSQIRTYVDLTDNDEFGIPGIPSEHVLIWPIEYDPREDGEDSIHAGDPPCPGVLITPGKVLSPPEEGENACDWISFPVLVQIVDRSVDKTDTNRLKLWLRWQRRIHRFFNMNNLRNEVTMLHLVYGASADAIEKYHFKISPLAVGVMPFIAQVEQTRDSRGYV